MGTRADFYVGRGESAEWLGSIAWDGNPNGIDDAVLRAATEEIYRETVAAFLKRDDGTLPEMGWPWPWNDSGTTDYAYAFEGSRVYGSCFGHAWWLLDLNSETWGEPEFDSDEPGDAAVFPDMTSRKNVTYGKRSGVIVIGGQS